LSRMVKLLMLESEGILHSSNMRHKKMLPEHWMLQIPGFFLSIFTLSFVPNVFLQLPLTFFCCCCYSKLMDKVISVEYAVKDDDSRGNGYSPERRRDRSPDRRRRSPSPYRRERGSPDYGRGASPVAHKRERTSPDYGRGRRSPSPYKRARLSPDYKRDDRRRERVASPENGAVRNRSPRKGRGESRSPPPYEKRRESRSPPPYEKRRESRSPPPYEKRRERSRSRSKSSPENGQVESPGQIMEVEAGRGYDGADSPIRERYHIPSYL